jgi:prepilin-type N-terminal cleavage/methylation domain-containing protein
MIRLATVTSGRPAAPRSAFRLRAFTLIELMISAAIMSLVLGAAYACLRAGLRGRRTVELRSLAVQRARVALQRMAADLRGACPLSSDREFGGQPRTLNGVKADLLDFATHHYTPRNLHEGDFCEVSYFLDPDPGTGAFSLWRRRDASPDLEPMGGGLRELIADGLRGLRFEYYDGLDWYDEWGDPEGKQVGRPQALLPVNATGLPEAVRISLWVDTEPAPRRAASNRAGQTKDHEAPSLMFQTVARLNLAPLADSQSTDGDAGDDTGKGGTP